MIHWYSNTWKVQWQQHIPLAGSGLENSACDVGGLCTLPWPQGSLRDRCASPWQRSCDLPVSDPNNVLPVDLPNSCRVELVTNFTPYSSTPGYTPDMCIQRNMGSTIKAVWRVVLHTLPSSPPPKIWQSYLSNFRMMFGSQSRGSNLVIPEITFRLSRCMWSQFYQRYRLTDGQTDHITWEYRALEEMLLV